MPLYNFQCTKCEHITELLTYDYSITTTPCEKCNSRAEKIVSGKQIFRGESNWNRYKIKDVPYGE